MMDYSDARRMADPSPGDRQKAIPYEEIRCDVCGFPVQCRVRIWGKERVVSCRCVYEQPKRTFDLRTGIPYLENPTSENPSTEVPVWESPNTGGSGTINN